MNTHKHQRKYLENISFNKQLTFVDVFSGRPYYNINKNSINDEEILSYHKSSSGDYMNIKSDGTTENIKSILTEKVSKRSSVLIIDSLSYLSYWNRSDELISFIMELTLIGEINSTIIFLHEDIHDEHFVKSVESISTSIIKLIDIPEEHAVPLTGSYTMIQKRKNGKVSRTKEHYYVDVNKQFHIYNDNAIKVQKPEIEKNEDMNFFNDGSLTFNLNINESQKEIKDSIILPHTTTGMKLHENENENQDSMIYIDDDDDAFEGSDPDDDLDI